MKPDEIRQLLGGYASGTLSETEKQILFEAALEDQVLFDAIADEQALKDLLDDPETRGYLQAVLDEEESRPVIEKLVRARVAPAPASPASVSSGPRMSESEHPRGRRPAVWWGAIAAATLAAVSVVGILRLNQPAEHMEIAKNEAPAPVAGGEPAAPVLPSPAADPKPAAPKTVVREKAAGPPAAPEPVLKAAEERRKDAKDQEAQKPRDEIARQSSGAAEARVNQQTEIPAAAPPPAPRQQQQPVKEANQPAPFVNSQVAQNQTETPPVQSARQIYFAGDPQAAASRESVAVEANSPAIVLDKAGPADSGKAKKSAPAGIVGGLAPGRASTPAAAVLSRASAFAMRYQVLRRSGGSTFLPAAPGARFRIGDELVVVIEKRSGGTAAVDRDGSPVPMALQTNTMARSVPLTVTGPMELAVVLSRPASASPRGIPQQAAAQKSEVADGMVYVAEPAAAGGQPLVARIAIRVE